MLNLLIFRRHKGSRKEVRPIFVSLVENDETDADFHMNTLEDELLVVFLGSTRARYFSGTSLDPICT